MGRYQEQKDGCIFLPPAPGSFHQWFCGLRHISPQRWKKLGGMGWVGGGGGLISLISVHWKDISLRPSSQIYPGQLVSGIHFSVVFCNFQLHQREITIYILFGSPCMMLPEDSGLDLPWQKSWRSRVSWSLFTVDSWRTEGKVEASVPKGGWDFSSAYFFAFFWDQDQWMKCKSSSPLSGISSIGLINLF